MRSVILSAGKSCFVACPGCYNHFAPTLAGTDAIVRFAARMHDRFGLEKITVGGGDPLTRPDIVELLCGLRGVGLRIHLDTVGTAFLGAAEIRFMGRGTAAGVSAARVAAAVDLIGIPLDGATDDVQRLFRRHSSITDQRAILEELDQVGARVCVNTVVHASNVDALDGIAALVAQHPCIRQWQLFQFMPIGPLGFRSRARFEVADQDVIDATSGLRALLPERVEVTVKSREGRKNRYLLIDSSGMIWIPEQSPAGQWEHHDGNPHRVKLGRIDAPAIGEAIAGVLAHDAWLSTTPE